MDLRHPLKLLPVLRSEILQVSASMMPLSVNAVAADIYEGDIGIAIIAASHFPEELLVFCEKNRIIVVRTPPRSQKSVRPILVLEPAALRAGISHILRCRRLSLVAADYADAYLFPFCNPILRR